jgi:hypothetical protein
MALLYRHIRLDTNQPFYVGIGKTEKRAYSIGRNAMWKNIISKTEYRVDIVLTDLTWEEACQKEREFIELYGRRDKGTGPLVNMTGGGDGGYGMIQSDEAREKIRQFQLSLNKKGKPGRVWTEESRKKLSTTLTGFKHSDEAKEKMRKPRLNTENYKKPKAKVPCKCCGFMAQPAAIKRWHNENCKKQIK